MSKRGVPLAPIPWSVVLTAGTEVEQEPAVVAKSHHLHVEGANAKLQMIEETPSGRPGSAPRRPLSASRPWSARSGVTRTDSLHSTLGPDEGDVEEAEGIREEMVRIRGLIEAASRGGADAEKEIEYLRVRLKSMEEQLVALGAPLPETNSAEADNVGRMYAVELKYPPSDKQLRRKYMGQLWNGKRQGLGVMLWWDGHVYEGEWADDRPSGLGLYGFEDEGRYEGELRAGKRHGLGRLVAEDGTIFDGHWAHDLMHGAVVTVERLSDVRPGQQRKVFGKRELLGLARYDRGVRVDSPRGSEASFASSVLVSGKEGARDDPAAVELRLQVKQVVAAAEQRAAAAKMYALTLATSGAGREIVETRTRGQPAATDAGAGQGWLAKRAARAQRLVRRHLPERAEGGDDDGQRRRSLRASVGLVSLALRGLAGFSGRFALPIPPGVTLDSEADKPDIRPRSPLKKRVGL